MFPNYPRQIPVSPPETPPDDHNQQFHELLADQPSALSCLSPFSSSSYNHSAVSYAAPLNLSISHIKSGSRLCTSVGRSSKQCHDFPWQPQVEYYGLRSQGRLVTPKLHVRLEKGFGLEQIRDRSPSDKLWTSYRRNYFSLQVSITFDPDDMQLPLFLHDKQVRALGYRLSAIVHVKNHQKPVDLVQYGPKREKDNIQSPLISVLSLAQLCDMPSSIGVPRPPDPTNPSFRPINRSVTATGAAGCALLDSALGNTPLSSNNTSHVFERIQFARATANNGKRRAQQQFYHLKVELLADIQAPNANVPQWERVVSRLSQGIIVRGRSPSHYKVEPADDGELDINSVAGFSPAVDPRKMLGLASDGPPSTLLNLGPYRYGRSYPQYTHANQYSASSSCSSTARRSVDLDVLDCNAPDDMIRNHTKNYQYYPSPMCKYPLNAGDDSAPQYPSPTRPLRLQPVRPEYPDSVVGFAWHDSYPADYEASTAAGIYARNLPPIF